VINLGVRVIWCLLELLGTPENKKHEKQKQQLQKSNSKTEKQCQRLQFHLNSYIIVVLKGDL